MFYNCFYGKIMKPQKYIRSYEIQQKNVLSKLGLLKFKIISIKIYYYICYKIE